MKEPRASESVQCKHVSGAAAEENPSKGRQGRAAHLLFGATFGVIEAALDFEGFLSELLETVVADSKEAKHGTLAYMMHAGYEAARGCSKVAS